MPTFIEKIMKNILILSTLLILSGCGYFKDYSPQNAPDISLGIHDQKPLDLLPVDWRVISVDDTPLYCVTTQNFKNLSNNIEEVQNRLDNNQTIMLELKQY